MRLDKDGIEFERQALRENVAGAMITRAAHMTAASQLQSTDALEVAGSDNAYEPSAASRDERPVTESERLVPVKLRIPGLRENQIQDPINWKSAVANKIRE